MAPPEELVRVVLGPDGELAVGRTLPGRGAWLCRGSDACVRAAAKRRAFGRALRAPVDPASVERLRTSLAECASMGSSAGGPIDRQGITGKD